MSSGYGRSKPGRPKAPPKAPQGPICETCSHLRTDGGKPVCGHWSGREITATDCPDHKDASKPRVILFGGITGYVGYERG